MFHSMRAPVLLVLGLFGSVAWADPPVRQEHHFGLGLGAGLGVTGVSGKYFLDTGHALQFVAGGWGFGKTLDKTRFPSGYGGSVGVEGAFLWEMPDFYEDEYVMLAWNFGAGASAAVGGWDWLGVSGVLGFEVDLMKFPLDAVLELRPGMGIILNNGDVVPDLFNLGAHARYYFN